MKQIFIILSFFLYGTVGAQNESSPIAATAVQSVVVHKDPRLDDLVKKKVEVNKTSKRSKARTARGYRLLVINTNSRADALAAKTKIWNTNRVALKPFAEWLN